MRGTRDYGVVAVIVLGLGAASAGPLQAGPPDAAEAWRAEVRRHRGDLRTVPVGDLAAVLTDPRPARVFAALSYESDGVTRYSLRDLEGVLRRARRRELARGAIHLIARRRTAGAFAAIAEHVRRQGAADAFGLRTLVTLWPALSKPLVLEVASVAEGRRDVDTVAIRALAGYPGDEVTVLLRGLETDWSEPIRVAASGALRTRAELGFGTEMPRKPVPTGLPIAQLARARPKEPTPEDLAIQEYVAKKAAERRDQEQLERLMRRSEEGRLENSTRPDAARFAEN